MCIRLKNLEKDDVIRAFLVIYIDTTWTGTKTRLIDFLPYYFASNTHKLDIYRHCINIVLNLQKNHINPWKVVGYIE